MCAVGLGKGVGARPHVYRDLVLVEENGGHKGDLCEAHGTLRTESQSKSAQKPMENWDRLFRLVFE